jgi:hypothetical protein
VSYSLDVNVLLLETVSASAGENGWKKKIAGTIVCSFFAQTA